MKRNVILALISLTVVILLCLGFPWFKFASEQSKGRACHSNLCMIDAAKEQAVHALGLKDGDPLPEKDVAKYCKDGLIPQCPSKGRYIIGVVGETPRCSLGNPKAESEKLGWHRIPIGAEEMPTIR